MAIFSSEHGGAGPLTADGSALLSELHFGYVGGYPLAGMGEPGTIRMEETFTALKAVGIGAVLSLTEDNPYGHLLQSAGFSHCHIPVHDCHAPSMLQMAAAMSFIDDSIGNGLRVAVHCMEGRGRTGTVLCAWVGRKERLNPEAAIRRIYELRPCSVITPPQRKFLHEFL
jgi:atypical dual specificity phosphatase